MERYNLLFEYIIKPDDYIKNIEEIIIESFNAIFNKQKSLKIITKELTKIFEKNKIKFITERNIDNGAEEYIFYGINYGAFLPDRYGTIGIFCNLNILKCINNINFFNKFKKWFLFICRHELVHRGQALQIKDKKIRADVLIKHDDDKIDYLSDKQEIMDRAWGIVELFRMNNFSDKEILKLLKTKNKEKLLILTLRIYHEMFSIDDSIMKLLYKYMFWYLT